jgi:hypothetical protein
MSDLLYQVSDINRKRVSKGSQSFVVNKHGKVSIFYQLMDRKHAVVWLAVGILSKGHKTV